MLLPAAGSLVPRYILFARCHSSLDRHYPIREPLPLPWPCPCEDVLVDAGASIMKPLLSMQVFIAFQATMVYTTRSMPNRAH